ncbi:MAG TPA: glycosyl hydrolase [Acetivibrio thermocellus]|uniref:glycosyl hydrolase n=1 Tax=Acetivibrio thermocellus TaxID=1515 RepID=UPI00017E1F88|nr:glycosyl hydrolase [Acetivibrio thermocellus]THJ78207.1 glycoside hydrolase [Acetivibrio thermocellus]CDG35355.1 glycoside hydrolase family 81 [Acetivibrio thermocellus BC1]HOP94003.1 glycosyl hydrolase [Acetivibrio thermocellus]
MLKKKTIISLVLAAIILGSIIQPFEIANAQYYREGTGSYTVVLPPGAKVPQAEIYKTSNLQGAVPTNSWESSILWNQYSLPIYAHPLTFKFKAEGIEVGKPALGGSGIVYFGAHKNDFTVGHSSVYTFPDARADKISDFAVDAVMASGSGSIKATLMKGSPYAYFVFTGGNPRIDFSGTPTVFYGDSGSQCLGVTINGVNYGLFAPSGSKWQGIGTGTITCILPAGKNYFSIAVLPDNTVSTLTYYKDYAYCFVTDTKVEWSYNETESTLTTTFTAEVSVKEGTNKGTILALYPHQWRNNPHILPLPYTYSTLRGIMKTIQGTSFKTVYRYHGILPNLPDKGTYDREALNRYINELALQADAPVAVDTYWFGKHLGKLSCALPIAEQLGNISAKDRFISFMKSSLEDWFTAKEGETAKLFYYDSNWGTLIGYPSSYGSDEELNDHHFHYGYFLHAAAQIALRDPQWASRDNWGAMVELLIKDIANWDRNDTRFPFLRNFDPYEGHSWASGHAGFADGNNQESSSEAINAWQAIILWGEATGNKTIRDLGIYLYTTEVEAVCNYWFDLYKDIFSPSYGHNYASMVWGGKYCHEIWWDGTNSEKHGINFLPITAASLYLGKDPNYIKQNYEEMLRECGTSQPPNWKDIQYMYYALYDPAAAKNMWNESIVPEDGESKAHTYHWICNLDSLGLPDFSVTADTPLYSVFNKNNIRTYVVYNASSSAKKVTFSDGKVMTVGPHSMAVSTGSESEVLAGDLNGDGKINSTDISLMKRYLLKQIVDLPVEDDIKAADINKDGKVNSTDMSILKRVILRNYPL